MATTDNYKLAQLELTSSANFPVLLNIMNYIYMYLYNTGMMM